MAIDDRDKRQSAHRVAVGYGLPNPDGTVDPNDRQHLLGFYGGILAVVLAAVLPALSQIADVLHRSEITSVMHRTEIGDAKHRNEIVEI